MATAARHRLRRAAAALAATALATAVTAGTAARVAAAPAAPAATPARGVDVSNYQHPGGVAIDWPQVRASGVDFAFIKATEGPVGCTGGPYTNGWLRRDWAGAGAAGVYRGAYHFARPGDTTSAVAQARAFAAAVGPMQGPLDLPPVLDLEVTCGLAAPQLAAFARAWVDEVVRLTGRTPIVYSYYYFWKDTMRAEPSLAHLPLWIATYGPRPLVPAPWTAWTFWQHADDGSVPGIAGHVDLDLFSGPTADLAALTAGGAALRGSLDLLIGADEAVTVAGWALDPRRRDPVDVHVTIDGALRRAATATGDRPDVGGAFPDAGAAHGYHLDIAGVAEGPHEVCVWAVPAGTGAGTLIGCRPTTVAGTTPIGALESATAGPASIRVRGWALDRDTPASIPVHVYLDGAMRGADAGGDRPDVATGHPALGTRHGFDVTLAAGPGEHRVCVYAINVAGRAENPLLACRTVRVRAGTPVGFLDVATAGRGTVTAAGWALDPDTLAPVDVHVYVGGRLRLVSRADRPRPDLAASDVAGYGTGHGYAATATGVDAGPRTVCAYAINGAGAGTNPLLGCRAVAVT